MAERVDVCIVGSGFGGSISAFRLAELYRAAGQSPSILVLERGPRHQHTDFRQSMDIEHALADLRAGPGRRARRSWSATASAAARTSTWPRRCARRRETFERRDHRPDDGPDRRMWPSQISRAALDPYYARAEEALRVQRPTWKQVAEVGRPVGGDARRRRAHLRPRAGRDRPEPLHPGEVVPHRLHLRRQELGDHQLPGLGRAARRRGAAELARPSWCARARRVRTATS